MVCRTVVPLVALALVAGCAPTGSYQEVPDDPLATGFDSTLAAELRADEYGMSRYVLALLKAGPNRGQDSLEAMALQRAHLANITRMAEEGDLLLAGPFLDEGELRGIYLFDVETVEEARRLTETDPAVKAGRLEMELHPWYGSAALRQVSKIHGRLERGGE